MNRVVDFHKNRPIFDDFVMLRLYLIVSTKSSFGGFPGTLGCKFLQFWVEWVQKLSHHLKKTIE
jgi:hypothetical protein